MSKVFEKLLGGNSVLIGVHGREFALMLDAGAMQGWKFLDIRSVQTYCPLKIKPVNEKIAKYFFKDPTLFFCCQIFPFKLFINLQIKAFAIFIIMNWFLLLIKAGQASVQWVDVHILGFFYSSCMTWQSQMNRSLILFFIIYLSTLFENMWETVA